MSNGKNSMNDLLQIRELIFGENIKEYDKKFTHIETALQKMNEALEKHDEKLRQLNDLLADMEKQLEAKMVSNHSQFDTQLKTLRRNFEEKLQELASDKTDRLQIGNYLIEMGLRLKGENVLDNLVEQNNSNKNG